MKAPDAGRTAADIADTRVSVLAKEGRAGVRFRVCLETGIEAHLAAKSTQLGDADSL
jgi:hypothetical protein